MAVAVAVAVAVVVVGFVGAVALTAGDDGDDGGVGALAGASVRLEPAAAPQPDPFVDVVLDPAVEAGESIDLPSADAPPLADGTGAGLSGKVADGTGAGLYGGSLDTAVCDVDQMVAFHSDSANAQVTAAFAEVQGIEVAEVVDYVRSLAPVRLRFDTRVTNHGLVDGRAAPFQSVLQAGTAVLVDATGVPRVKCFCGNPLVEPQPVGQGEDPSGLIENPDDTWEGFDPDGVVAVEPGNPTGGLIVVDLETGEPVEKPVGDGTGEGGSEAPPDRSTTNDPGGTGTTSMTSPGEPPGGGGGSPGTTCTSTAEQVICYAD